MLNEPDLSNPSPDCGCDAAEHHMLSVETAQELILQATPVLTVTERLSLRQCLGRILANEIHATINVPSHRNSAMDGYAFAHNGADTGSNFEVIGQSLAGHPFQGELGKGQCIRIMTGAILPETADTVVMQEHTSFNDKQLRVNRIPSRDANVRHPGEDLKQGEPILPASHKINTADLGLLASQGVAELDVLRRPRIAFFSTGDELKSIGETLSPGDVYDSNRYTLYGMLKKLGMDILDMGVIPDQPEKVEQAFAEAGRLADMVITSGGVSVGDADYVTETLRKTGSVNFWKIAVKPGKPLAFGKLNERCQFFGLPGNPVAVMATFLIFVRPAILKMCGEAAEDLVEHPAISDTPVYKSPGRKEYQRGICHRDAKGQWHVQNTGMQGSHILRSMSVANCFIVLPQLTGNLDAGTAVTIMPFAGLL